MHFTGEAERCLGTTKRLDPLVIKPVAPRVLPQKAQKKEKKHFGLFFLLY